jgi:hypothetical protein
MKPILARLGARFLTLPVLAFALLYSAIASAQTVPPTPITITGLTTPMIVVALLGLVSAYVAQGATTGSVLGLFKVSPALIPYLTVGATFLGELVPQLNAAAQANAMTASAVFNAIVMSLFLLVAPATGSALRHHIDTPKLRQQLNAASGTIPPPAPPKAPLGVVTTLLCILALCLTGCLSSTPIVPVTTANQAQVSQCESTATFHDAVVVGDVSFGIAGGTLAAAAGAVPPSNQGLQLGLGIAGAVAGAVMAGGAGLAELTAANFANQGCPSVVGALPAAAGGAK